MVTFGWIFLRVIKNKLLQLGRWLSSKVLDLQAGGTDFDPRGPVKTPNLGVVGMYTCNPSAREVETEGSLGLSGLTA